MTDTTRFTDEQCERSFFQLLLDAHDKAMWNWRALAERGCSTEEYNEADDARDATRKRIEDFVSLLEGERNEASRRYITTRERQDELMAEVAALRSQVALLEGEALHLAKSHEAAAESYPEGRKQEWTDERVGELLDWLDEETEITKLEVVCRDAIRFLRSRCSLLEGERGRFAHELERINEGGKALDKVIPARVGESKADHLRRVAVEVAALRSRLDEARAQIADMEASPNWLSGHHHGETQ
jgi:chromosome segregation ATPase